MGRRWSQIDRLEIGGYPFLSEDDLCFYLLERQRGTWRASEANNIVNNFQKSPELYGERPDVMVYKQQAVEYFAKAIELLIGHKERRFPLVLVPMITSRPKSAQWHDPRLSDTAEKVARDRSGEVVVCDILDVDEVLEKSKAGGMRQPWAIREHIVVAGDTPPDADIVFLIDDVITTGGHFTACKEVVRPIFPDAQIVGVFLSRQAPIGNVL